MNNLEEWYHRNRQRCKEMGIALTTSPDKPIRYIDGEFGRYEFRFIDREDSSPDIEIMDTISGKTIYYAPDPSDRPIYLTYDAAIDRILKL